jgi:hypothetical protein
MTIKEMHEDHKYRMKNHKELRRKAILARIMAKAEADKNAKSD